MNVYSGTGYTLSYAEVSVSFSHTIVTGKWNPRGVFLAVVGECGLGNEEGVSSAYIGGIQMEQIAFYRQSTASAEQFAYIFAVFHGDGPDTGSRTCLINLLNSEIDGVNGYAYIFEVDGIRSKDYLDDTDTYEGESVSSVSLSLVSKCEDSIIIAVYSGGSDAGTVTLNSGQTALVDLYTSAVYIVVSYEIVGVGTNAHNMSFSGTPNRSVSCGILLSPYRSNMAKFV